jgi:Ca2+/Na+ antiporter
MSIALLYWALLDKKISFSESTLLLGAAFVYVAAVYFTKDVEEKFFGAKTVLTESKKAASFAAHSIKPNDEESVYKAIPHTASPFGIEVDVEEIFHGRMVPNQKEHVEIKTNASSGNLELQTTDPSKGFHLTSASDAALLGPQLEFKNLKEIQYQGGNTITLEFEKGVLGGLVLEKMSLKMTCAQGSDRDDLVSKLKEQVPNVSVAEHYDATIIGGLHHFKHLMADKDMSIWIKIVYGLPELFIDSLLRLTLFAVDIKDVKKENRWPLCFCGAMVWLATFSFMMLECANMIHYYIPPIPTSFLGITVCAVGTSFPNAVASVILSSQDKPAAAIANALGSNIQNVFLAMAFPWVIYQANHGFMDIPQEVAGISEGVVWMVGTLVVVVLFALIPPVCMLTKPFGWILNFIYGLYVVDISGETFGLWQPFLK